jgi:hypothetical protein
MAQPLRRSWPYGLGLAILLATVLGGASQTPEAKPALPPTKSDIDAMIEKSFGSDSAESRRPIRLWFRDNGLVVAAKEATFNQTGEARFVDVSIFTAADSKTFRASQGTFSFDKAVEAIDQLPIRSVLVMELLTKNGTMTLGVPRSSNNEVVFTTVQRSVNGTIVTERIPTAVPAPPAMAPAPAQPALAASSPAVVPTPPSPVEIRFRFKIDPKSNLLPAPAKSLTRRPIPFNEDLTKVPEITFGEPIAKDLAKQDAMEATAHAMAKINHLNLKKTDGFMLAMLDKRADLRGMPFLMGEECRTREDQARVFSHVAEAVQQALRGVKANDNDNLGDGLSAFSIATLDSKQFTAMRANQEMVHRAMVAALTQILMPESELIRVKLARGLATIPHADASKALARLALFSPEDDVRAAAIEGLKLRRERDYTDVLVQGFHYPLPAVAKRSAEALVKLECKDVLADLVDVLERPDPRLPVTEKRAGQEVTTVRELVKVNHHRNCLLCHAPGNTDNTPEGVLKVAVPLPTEPLPKPSDGGGYQKAPPTSDMVVRLDMTYLRQDFSLMMPVADAHPWPDLQRFDFLVRTRPLTPEDMAAYEARREAEEPGRPSAYHRAALFALRELTGRDAEPTASAWRKLLNLAKRSG